mmetsp:Transcript_16259/g.21999  ORF Transcript_16259/g.21999 Transcript_16259/m.21999 type:complete len:163 (+) Transcript_16259:387-875(+)|eukprot:CAMPEP_0185596476 /NCGR_PEP_ID=MMETSP0434-20130131/80776_1 /TAXON_ID=626734 ORGANISM="Favella taraikaensis, Strain Fe Narragansett Bay" /NCGR_SAMPLE_ID=MMETSP0434 /ASSEMBLY_ACC=CAM_ASM_000379 /LENGTH=162 /DNA_ID=CAMNT_0028224989 /DNA_START=1358 /DNA_END=1846 /DNA_ORIENTATION=-
MEAISNKAEEDLLNQTADSVIVVAANNRRRARSPPEYTDKLKEGLKRKVSSVKRYEVGKRGSPTERNTSQRQAFVQSVAESYLRASEKEVNNQLSSFSNISNTNRKSSAGRVASPFRIVNAETISSQPQLQQQRVEFENWKDKNIRLNRVPNYVPTRSLQQQ